MRCNLVSESPKTRVYTEDDVAPLSVFDLVYLREQMKSAITDVIGAKRADELFPSLPPIKFRRPPHWTD